MHAAVRPARRWRPHGVRGRQAHLLLTIQLLSRPGMGPATLVAMTTCAHADGGPRRSDRPAAAVRAQGWIPGRRRPGCGAGAGAVTAHLLPAAAGSKPVANVCLGARLGLGPGRNWVPAKGRQRRQAPSEIVSDAHSSASERVLTSRHHAISDAQAASRHQRCSQLRRVNEVDSGSEGVIQLLMSFCLRVLFAPGHGACAWAAVSRWAALGSARAAWEERHAPRQIIGTSRSLLPSFLVFSLAAIVPSELGGAVRCDALVPCPVRERCEVLAGRDCLPGAICISLCRPERSVRRRRTWVAKGKLPPQL